MNIARLSALVLCASAVLAPLGALRAQDPQQRANENLNRIAGRINADITALNQNGDFYGGHRAAAIQQLQRAHGELNAALQWAISNGRGTGAVLPGAAMAQSSSAGKRNLATSNASMNAVRNDVQALTGALNQATGDYGGHRLNAIKAMQNAIGELNAGLAYQQTHK